MRKLFSFCAAMLVALAVNAATPVAAGAGTLTTAITDATAGDTLVLGSGSFSENGDYSINKNIVIMADAGATPVVSNHYYFKVDGGAQVTFKGIEFDGSGASDHCIRSHNNSTGAEVLTMEDCVFHNYPSYVLYTQRNSRKWHALILRGCHFYSNTKHAVAIIYEGSSATSCDSVVVENCTFENTTGGYNAVLVQDGNTTNLKVDHNTFYNFGGAFIKTGASVTNVVVSNNIFAQPTAGTIVPVDIAAGTINNCLTFNTADLPATATACVTGDPLFANAAAGDFTLGAGSPALTAASDGGAVGDLCWAPAGPTIENGFYLIGPDWSLSALKAQFEANSAQAGEYLLSAPLVVGDALKVVKVENDAITAWYPDGMGNEYVVDAAHAGAKTIYFRETYQNDWAAFGGYIWIEANTPESLEALQAEAKAVKVIENGRLIIIREGVRYNALGQAE